MMMSQKLQGRSSLYIGGCRLMGGISGVGRAALEKDWSMIGQQMLGPTMYGPRITKDADDGEDGLPSREGGNVNPIVVSQPSLAGARTAASIFRTIQARP
jgi:hypothetical protein